MLNIEEIKTEIVKRLLPLEPDRIILFGSYAYGIPNDDSDLDILIIKNDYRDKWEEKVKIRKALKSIRVSKDILIEKEDYFLSHSNDKWINTALYDAKNRGEILYG
ncbi:nucleotidyltransferase domain-containing protein [Sulfurimonas sp.]